MCGLAIFVDDVCCFVILERGAVALVYEYEYLRGTLWILNEVFALQLLLLLRR